LLKTGRAADKSPADRRSPPAQIQPAIASDDLTASSASGPSRPRPRRLTHPKPS
jgi:hypothetical protein